MGAGMVLWSAVGTGVEGSRVGLWEWLLLLWTCWLLEKWELLLMIKVLVVEVVWGCLRSN